MCPPWSCPDKYMSWKKIRSNCWRRDLKQMTEKGPPHSLQGDRLKAQGHPGSQGVPVQRHQREKRRIPTHLAAPGKKPPWSWLSFWPLPTTVRPNLAHCTEQMIRKMSAPQNKTHYLIFNTAEPFRLKPLFLYT